MREGDPGEWESFSPSGADRSNHAHQADAYPSACKQTQNGNDKKQNVDEEGQSLRARGGTLQRFNLPRPKGAPVVHTPDCGMAGNGVRHWRRGLKRPLETGTKQG